MRLSVMQKALRLPLFYFFIFFLSVVVFGRTGRSISHMLCLQLPRTHATNRIFAQKFFHKLLFEKRAAHDKRRACKLIHSNQHSQHPKKNKEQPETRKIQESSEREIDSDEKKCVQKRKSIDTPCKSNINAAAE